MRRLLPLVAAAAALAAGAAHAATPVVTTSVQQKVGALSHRPGRPLYWLGLHYQGLALINASSFGPAPVDLAYGDCTVDELNTFSSACHRFVSVLDVPAVEPDPTITGRCVLSATVRGTSAAAFVQNGRTLLYVFTPGATIEIGSTTVEVDLAAARALVGLNVHLAAGAPLPARDVRGQLGPCHAAPPQTLTAKQAYEQKMKSAFFIQSVAYMTLPSSFTVGNLDPQSAVDRFLESLGEFPDLLRNEAAHLQQITPPAAVADLHAQLIAGLDKDAADLDQVKTLLLGGAWKYAEGWAASAAQYNAALYHDARAIVNTARAFASRGYVVYVKPTED
jgi:hypothetical protein